MFIQSSVKSMMTLYNVGRSTIHRVCFSQGRHFLVQRAVLVWSSQVAVCCVLCFRFLFFPMDVRPQGTEVSGRHLLGFAQSWPKGHQE